MKFTTEQPVELISNRYKNVSLNNVPLIVNQAKTIDGTLPTTMAEDSLSYGKEEYISF